MKTHIKKITCDCCGKEVDLIDKDKKIDEVAIKDITTVRFGYSEFFDYDDHLLTSIDNDIDLCNDCREKMVEKIIDSMTRRLRDGR